MPLESAVGRRFRVGLVVLIALVFLMFGVLMVGRRAHLFTSKLPYQTQFESAAGLVSGNPVRLNGVTVGNVLEVNLSPDPADQTVRVIYEVDRKIAPRLRTGTTAAIKTIGLLGDKYVELVGGKADEPVVEPGGTIKAAAGGGLDDILKGSGDLLTDLSAIARSLKTILGNTEQGKGFIGELFAPGGEAGGRLANNLNGTLTSLNAVLGEDRPGRGPRGQAPRGQALRRPGRPVAPGGGRVAAQRLREDRGRNEQGHRSHPGPPLRPRGEEEGLRPGRSPVRDGGQPRRGHREPEDGQGRPADAPERRAVRPGVHREPARSLEAARFHRAQARRRPGHRRQVDQRSRDLRRGATTSSSGSTSRRSCAGSSGTVRDRASGSDTSPSPESRPTRSLPRSRTSTCRLPPAEVRFRRRRRPRRFRGLEPPRHGGSRVHRVPPLPAPPRPRRPGGRRGRLQRLLRSRR